MASNMPSDKEWNEYSTTPYCVCVSVTAVVVISMCVCVRAFIFKHDDYVWWEYVCACDWITLIHRIGVRAHERFNDECVTCYKIIWARNCIANKMRFSELPRELTALSSLVGVIWMGAKKKQFKIAKNKDVCYRVSLSLSVCVCVCDTPPIDRPCEKRCAPR